MNTPAGRPSLFSELKRLFLTTPSGAATDNDNSELLGQIAAINRSQAVIEFKTDGTIAAANANFLALVGYTLAEIVGRHHSIFVDPAYRASAEYQQFWEQLVRGEYDKAQYRRVGKGGREVWLEASYNPILDANGRTVKVIKFATDITAQKHKDRMNTALKNSLEAVTAKIMATDEDYNVIFVNKAANDLMLSAQSEIRNSLPDFDASRLLGSNIAIFFNGSVGQDSLERHFQGTTNTQIELGSRTMSLTGNPMYDDSGARMGTVFEWSDRTDVLQTESELQGIISAVVGGDLQARIDLAGKSGFIAMLSHKINDLIDAFADVVRHVKVAAAEVARGSQEISQGNADLSQRTEAQASSLEKTAASMEEMTASVRQNADNSGQANQLAVAARDQADKGGAVVAKAVKAMGEINQSSKKIADIIGVIDEIAFQTNLLALNAAVEAARAGEQGRGFAVVATEVRSLAGRSATAAKEIKALIRDSVQKVEEGSSLVAQSGYTLEQIVHAVKKVSDIIAEIAASSHEQSSGIEQVNSAVIQLDEMTQQNAALVEQATAASKSMAIQSQGLSDVLSRYDVKGAGNSAAAAAPPKIREDAKPASKRPAKSFRTKATVGGNLAWKQF